MYADVVPAGWQRLSLGEVARIVMGQSPPGATVTDWDHRAPCMADTGLPFVQGNAEFTSRSPIPCKWCSVPLKVAEPGDVLISVRAPVGALNVSHRRLAIGRGLAAIRFSGVDPRFGWHALMLSNALLSRVSQGTTFEAVNANDLQALPVLVPPRVEQVRIADTLDAIDQAIEKTEAVIEATERLRQALLQELLTRGVPGWHSEWKHVPGIGTIPADWEIVTLGEVAEVTSGLAIGPHRKPRAHPKRYLTVANVQAGAVTLGEVRYMELTGREYASRRLVAGDLVLVEGHAQISELGRAAVVPPEASGFVFQNHLFRVRGRPGLCANRFICEFINGPQGRSYFRSFGGTTSGLNTVSASNVKAMPTPLPG
ncbi:MAG: restriction endonuclease subunit S, partial [Chloroflexota bacterium]